MSLFNLIIPIFHPESVFTSACDLGAALQTNGLFRSREFVSQRPMKKSRVSATHSIVTELRESILRGSWLAHGAMSRNELNWTEVTDGGESEVFN